MGGDREWGRQREGRGRYEEAGNKNALKNLRNASYFALWGCSVGGYRHVSYIS